MDEQTTMLEGFNDINPFIKNAVFTVWLNLEGTQYYRMQFANRAGFEETFYEIVKEISERLPKDPTAPATDMTSPVFDLEAFREAINSNGGYEDVKDCFDGLVFDALDGYPDSGFTEEEIEQTEEITQIIKEEVTKAVNELVTFLNSDEYQKIRTLITKKRRKGTRSNAPAESEIIKIKSLQLFASDPQDLRTILEKTSPGQAEQIIEDLQVIQGITPRSHVMPNNPLMNDLTTKKAINAGEYDMVVRNASKRQREITAYTMITFDPGETDITITDAKLSEYERQVSDAIISLWREAKEQQLRPIFTADMIFRAMPGGGDKASPQQRGAITKTIEKFRRLKIYVDATEEAKRRGLDLKGGKYVFDEYYLQVRRHTFQIKNGGAIVQGYEILSQPIVYTYSKLTKQILTTPADNILIREVKDGIITPVPLMMNANRQALTGYMLRRILIMKRSRTDAQDKKRSYDAKRKKAAKNGDILPEKPLEDFIEQKPVILFATMFAETGTATENRQQTQYNRDFCFSVLDFWKAKGLIKGYSIRRTGRAITALEIEL